MSLHLSWPVLCLSAYGAIVAGLLWANHRWCVLHDDATEPEPKDDVTFLPTLPPVPPTRSELAWLRDQPVEILTGVDLRWRFDDVIAGGYR